LVVARNLLEHLVMRASLAALRIALLAALCGASACNDSSNPCSPKDEGKSFCTECGAGYECMGGRAVSFFDGVCDARSAACKVRGTPDSGNQDPDADPSDPGQCNPLPELPRPTGGTCGAGKFLYEDESCPGIKGARHVNELDGGSVDDASVCHEMGDGLCHTKCETDKDCKDPCRPHCTDVGLWSGGDYGCNGTVRMCSDQVQDYCTQ
jgi:hypothetical protein